MKAAVCALMSVTVIAGCIPPPKCGFAANIEAWRKEDRPPPPADNEMGWWKTGCARGDQRVRTVVHVASPMPGIGPKGADVFFMPATTYAVWLMTHATANGAKGLPIAVDPLVLQSFSKQAVADADGNADLGANFPGLYVAFTVYDVLSPGELIRNRDVFVYERVFEIGREASGATTIELAPTKHMLNPPSTPAPLTYKGTLVDVRRVHDEGS